MRQEVFFKRLEGQAQPWTNDPILQVHKFTNAYRAADRVSQYLIKNIIYYTDCSAEDHVLRILLFKIFNKIETWKLLEQELGSISWSSFKPALLGEVLSNAMHRGERIYSGAYIMASGKTIFGHDQKHLNHLDMLEDAMQKGLIEKIRSAPNMEQLYQLLLGLPTIGPFLAYQLATDLNYSEVIDFSEMSFVKAGPGARDGISKCFPERGEYSDEDIIRMVTEEQDQMFEKFEIPFRNLWGRKLQLIDCQNLFCETDKYCRVAYPDITGSSKRTRIKQKFTPSQEGKIEYSFPPKWGISQG